ncbi:MAG: uroporphyrinogen-III synthase [Acidimicrobiaceae bacterium]|nr:uroporphyrinogen-III synthase [Acidimicrobiaceae bacterium]MYG56971.1 uroporphyrinogen-III synthase [Acidimicrobiaceae bacterium]
MQGCWHHSTVRRWFGVNAAAAIQTRWAAVSPATCLTTLGAVLCWRISDRQTVGKQTVGRQTERERPLDGVRVVVTRARHQAGGLADTLEELGATAVVVPVIEIEDPPDGGAALSEHLAALGPGDWLVITSPNGATKVAEALSLVPLNEGVSVAVIGPGTRDRAQNSGIKVDLVPDSSIAEGLLESFPRPDSGDATVLLARALEARRLLPEGLRELGWTVHDVAAYRTVGVPVTDTDIIACRESDVVAFTSSSTVSHLCAAVGLDNLPEIVVCIGPATAATARGLGLNVDVVAEPHTIDGLISAVVDCRSAAANSSR